MNSGKTTRILQCAFNYEEQGMKPIIMKPKVDTKGNEYIISRIGSKRKVDHLIESTENIYDYIVEKYTNVDLIIIDEAQFLNEKQVNGLMDVVIDLNIPVMCYGLRTDFLGNSFPGSRRLLDIAHELTEIKTICECGKKAMFNVRLIDGKVQTEGDSVAIDGEGKVTYTVQEAIVNLWNPFELVSSEIAFLWCTGVTMPICKGRTPVAPLKIG